MVCRWPLARAGFLCGLCFAVGLNAAGLATRRAPAWDELPRNAVVLRGVVGGVDILPVGRRLTITAASLDGGKVLARAVRVRLRNNDPVEIAAGDTVRVRALLRAPAAPVYPGGWDMQRDAYFGGLAAFGFAIGPATREQVATRGAMARVRGAVAARVMAALPGPRGAIAATLLAGIGSAIPPADRAAFQASGLAHLLAVAGLHIGIVMGLVFGFCRAGLAASEYTALRWPTRRLAAVAALVAGGGYLLLTGGHVPILRSFAMACLVTLAVLTGRRAVSMRALALAASLIAVAAPSEVVGVSFQMSFAAVLALVAGWEKLRPHVAVVGQGRWWRRPAAYAAGLAATSLLAGTATLPVAAYHFGNAMLWYVPANLVAVPITALWVMPCGVAALVAMPVGLERLALVPMGWGISALLWIAHQVAAWPASVVPVPAMPPAALLLYSVGLVWLCLWRSGLRVAGLAPMAAGLAVALLARPPDMLISGDGRVVAARVAGRVLAAMGPGASGFERDAAARVWGVSAGLVLVTKAADGLDGVACAQGVCSLTFPGGIVDYMGGADAPCGDAGGAGARVAVWPLHAAGMFWPLHTAGMCGFETLIDRQYLAGEGAVSLTMRDGHAALRSDRMARGDRPWVLRDRPVVPVGLPMAQAE